MAPKRRGGSGFRTPELRGTLGTLFRTALEQASGMREVLERSARTGRERIDELRADRRRTELLADLGETVLELIRQGEIDLDELPEAQDLVRQLDELDADGGDYADEPPAPRSRSRFDDRPSPGRRPAPRAPTGHRARGGHDRDDDGTVSSGARWATPRPPARAAVWRPPVDDVPSAPAGDEAGPSPARRSFVPSPPHHPHRKGGITFDDEDLADYMHPDDVPPRGTDGDS